MENLEKERQETQRKRQRERDTYTERGGRAGKRRKYEKYQLMKTY